MPYALSVRILPIFVLLSKAVISLCVLQSTAKTGSRRGLTQDQSALPANAAGVKLTAQDEQREGMRLHTPSPF